MLFSFLQPAAWQGGKMAERKEKGGECVCVCGMDRGPQGGVEQRGVGGVN